VAVPVGRWTGARRADGVIPLSDELLVVRPGELSDRLPARTGSARIDGPSRLAPPLLWDNRQEATMKTTLKILSLVSFLSLSFAGVAHAGDNRGEVLVKAAAAKAVVAGPAVIHVYSGFSGAKVFVADAAKGTDADCAGAAGRAAGSALVADRVETVAVGAGQVACVASTGAHTIDLLWHAVASTPSTTLVAKR
jgi:hypothetical protein